MKKEKLDRKEKRMDFDLVTLLIWLIKIGEKLFVMGDTYEVSICIKTGIFDAYGCIIVQLLQNEVQQKRRAKIDFSGAQLRDSVMEA